MRIVLAAAVSAFVVSSILSADETATNSMLMSLPKNWQLSFDAPEDTDLELFQRPILSWSNPIRNSPVGAAFLWTYQSRPVAAMCAYPNLGNVDYEFQSLTTHPLVAVNSLGQKMWQPREAGIEVNYLSDAKVAKLRKLRTVQMRGIARQFAADIIRTREPTKSTRLRLLPTPLYRYPENISDYKDRSTSNAPRLGKLIDGALFCFAQSTDPEVLLMLEVWQDEAGELSYTYGLARMSIVILQVKHNDAVIWKTKWGNTKLTEKYFTVKSSDQWPGDK